MVLRTLTLLSLSSLLIACGGSDDSESTPPPTNTVETIYISNAAGNSAGLSVTESSASELFCPRGGIELGVTADTNDDGVIDAAEQAQAISIALCTEEPSRVMYALQQVPSQVCGGNAGLAMSLYWDADRDYFQGTDEDLGILALCLDTEHQTVILEATPEEHIDGCRYGGHQIAAGLDANADNALSEGENSIDKSLCGTSPHFSLGGVSADPVVPGDTWFGSVYFSHNTDSAIPEVPQASLSNHPSWLQINDVTDSYVFLSGVPDEVGKYTATLTVTRGDYTESREITITVSDGIRLSVDMVNDEQVRIISPQTFDEDIEVLFLLSRGAGSNYTTGSLRSVILPAGEISVLVDTMLNEIDSDGLFSISNVMIAEVRHPDLDKVFLATNNYFIKSLDTLLELPAVDDQSMSLSCRVTKLRLAGESFSTTTRYCNFHDTGLIQGPLWSRVSNNSRPYLTFDRAIDHVGDIGTLAVRFTLEDGQTYEVSRNYIVVVPDSDGDETPDDQDAFPDNSKYSSDYDADGVADEWELFHFDSLGTITSTSDFDSDGVSDKQAFLNDHPLSPFGFDFEEGELPSDWRNLDDVAWEITEEQVYQGSFALRGKDYAEIQFPIDVLSSTVDYRIRFEGEAYSYVRWSFSPVNGLGSSYTHTINSSTAKFGHWTYAAFTTLPGSYLVTLRVYGDENTAVYLDQISGFARPISGDEDQDGIPNYLENYIEEPVIIENDRDSDGVADEDDLYPDNPEFATDSDSDGLPDEWENQYGRTWYFSATGDRDNDGVKDFDEFIAGTHPDRYNLMLVNDVKRINWGETIELDLVANDRGAGTIELDEIPDLQEGLLSYVDGVVSYTAPDDYTGWITANYIASSEHESSTGNLLIYVSDAPKPEFSKISVGAGYAAAALTPDGDLYTWGRNDEGQLGDGSFSQKTIPVKILEGVSDVVVSLQYVLALMQDGRVLYWGEDIASPQEATLPENITVKQIETYDRNYLLLLADDGTVWRGRFNILDDTAPVLEETLPEISILASGYDHTLALTVNGTVMALGYNNYGSLGNGTTISSYSEWVSVLKLSEPVVNVFAGGNKSYALTETGVLYGWGENNYQSLGEGTSVDRNVPVWIADGISEVAPGYYNTLLLNEAGRVFVAGTQSYGNFGVPCDSNAVLCDLGITATLVESYSKIAFLSTSGGLLFSGESNYGVAGNGTVSSSVATGNVLFGLESYFSEPGLETFENSASLVNWSNGGAQWKVTEAEAASGSYSLLLEGGEDNQSTSLSVESETVSGEVGFMVKTSTEANYDELLFLVDGEEKLRLSGDNGWMSAGPFAVEAGRHTFEWRYVKDGGTAGGLDSIWLDDISIPLDTDSDGILDWDDPEPNRI